MNPLSKPLSFSGIICPLINILILAIVSGCHDGVGTMDQFEKINFKIVILGEDQMEGTVFAPGTDISPALKLINNSGKDLEWKYDYECQLIQTENFLLVYKREDESYMPVGLPYSQIACLMMDVPPRKLPPGESMLIKLPWSTNPDNHPLSAGEYYTISNLALKINGWSGKWNLRTDFEIK